MRLPKKLTKEQRVALLKLLQKKKGVDSAEIRAEVAKILKGGAAIPRFASKAHLSQEIQMNRRFLSKNGPSGRESLDLTR